ncbi:carbon storage regulator CsrA [Ornithinibacillus sp. 4-3]|uniref:Translational regulator CsrA n=1 Tax=Ornithinibacillus sp. 4-3 TaxID=3231488 RepID=A0AB39HN03_9BACI
MLVLTRKKGEAIQIGDQIEVKILSIDGDQIKIGINAPQAVEIFRKEIYNEILQQNNEAANVNVDVLSLLKNNEES